MSGAENESRFLDAMGRLGPALLSSIDALERARRHLHPPRFGEIRAALEPIAARLDRAAADFRATAAPAQLQDLAARLLDSADAAAAVLRAVRQPRQVRRQRPGRYVPGVARQRAVQGGAGLVLEPAPGLAGSVRPRGANKAMP